MEIGEVWLAWDSLLRRNVALKLLRFDRAANPELVKRFEREAQAAELAQHGRLVGGVAPHQRRPVQHRSHFILPVGLGNRAEVPVQVGVVELGVRPVPRSVTNRLSGP